MKEVPIKVFAESLSLIHSFAALDGLTDCVSELMTPRNDDILLRC